MKRNGIVIAVTVCALALMVWAGLQNFKRRRVEQQRAQGVLVPDLSNQTVAHDIDANEGLPKMRGKKAPNFTLRTPEGKKVSLADYKGKAVLINFWATWCPPCKVEMPWFVDLHNQYASQGLEILGISEDDPKARADVSKYRDKTGVNYPVVMGDEAVEKAYRCCEFLPTSYYIGRDGKVVEEAAGLGSREQVEANIKKALAAGGQ